MCDCTAAVFILRPLKDLSAEQCVHNNYTITKNICIILIIVVYLAIGPLLSSAGDGWVTLEDTFCSMHAALINKGHSTHAQETWIPEGVVSKSILRASSSVDSGSCSSSQLSSKLQ